MASYKREVYIANTLKYIHLLPEEEQKKEYEIMMLKLRSVRKGQYDPKHLKLTKKIFCLASKVPVNKKKAHKHFLFYAYQSFLLTLCT